jgi:CSLREA domain-containing protein
MSTERRCPTIRKRLSYCYYPVALYTGCLFLLIVSTSWPAGTLITSQQTTEMLPAGSHSTLNVTKLADTNDGTCDTDCSLREALAVAAPDDVIVFASNLAGSITLGSTLTISKNVTINGPGTKAITISGQNAARVFYVDSGVHFTITRLTVANGRIQGSIGVSAEMGGSGGDGLGGGLYNNGGRVTIVDSTFSGNSAVGGPGGDAAAATPISLNNPGNGGQACGGAIYSTIHDTWLSNCTLAGNKASGGKGGWGRTVATQDGAVLLAMPNGAPGVGLGGAIYRPAALPMKNKLVMNRSGVITIRNTLIANSSSGGNCEASIISVGYNIDSDGTCGLGATGDLSKINPKLGPLKNNGGPTLTHALLPGSPAIDVGDPTGCIDHNGAVIATDQRGRSRSGRCDVGAIEFSR